MPFYLNTEVVHASLERSPGLPSLGSTDLNNNISQINVNSLALAVKRTAAVGKSSALLLLCHYRAFNHSQTEHTHTHRKSTVPGHPVSHMSIERDLFLPRDSRRPATCRRCAEAASRAEDQATLRREHARAPTSTLKLWRATYRFDPMLVRLLIRRDWEQSCTKSETNEGFATFYNFFFNKKLISDTIFYNLIKLCYI